MTDRTDGRWVDYALKLEASAVVLRVLEDMKPVERSFRVIRRCD